MKKSILMLLACTSFLFVAAQEEIEVETLKQFAGAKNFETRIHPFSEDATFNNFRYRYFFSETSAIRANLQFNTASQSRFQNTMDNVGNIVALERKNSSMILGVGLGIEKHLNGTNRLSPYFGAGLSFGISNSKQEEEYFDYNLNEKYNQTIKNLNGYLQYGLNAVIGVDYYFSKNIYIGTELGLGTSIRDYKNSVTTSTRQGVEVNETPGGTFFNFSTSSVGSIRFGFLF